MTQSPEDIQSRLQRYADRHQLQIIDQPGFGVHGTVFSTDRQTALKLFAAEYAYQRERDVYVRLQEESMVEVRGFNVPQLINYDDELWAIEMTLVTRPFVLDFAGANRDVPPEYFEDEQILIEWQADRATHFGENWYEVQVVMFAFQRYGIYLGDIHSGNISFRD